MKLSCKSKTIPSTLCSSLLSADRAMSSPASSCFLPSTLRIIKINEINTGLQSTTRNIKNTGGKSMGVIIEHKRKGVPAFQKSARPSRLSSSLQAAAANAHRAMPPASPHGENFAEVVLVRHGETDWNVSGMVQGRMDQELNEKGRQQAALVAHRLSEETKPAAVYSSNLTRATETAQMIQGACGVPDSDLVIDQALTERHMGMFQGWSIDDAIKSEAYKAFASGGRDQELPGGGESLNQLSERCVPRLNAIAEKHKGERVVVVSHEAVIKEICWHADPTSSVRREFPNTSITVVHVSGSDGRWILEKFGDIGHLTDDGFPQSASSGDGASAAIKNMAETSCKIPAGTLSNEVLLKKNEDNKAVGDNKDTKKAISSEKKNMKKQDNDDDNEPIKKAKK